MVIFPNAKINLGLRVKAKRQDGYHELDTVFIPIPLKDVLEVVTQNGDTEHDFSFNQTGLPIPGDLNSNLCYQAYRLLKNDHPNLPPIKVHLHKIIPMGAGLGGGSSDGAFMLRLLNEKFNLNIDAAGLKNYALQLGSDCPFFINNQPSYATGRGEIMAPVHVDLHGLNLMLVCPGIHVSTKLAFSSIGLYPDAPSSGVIVQQPIETWKYTLMNDFEDAVFPLYPEVKQIKETLYQKGAVYAAMSGSGSTVFGFFKEEIEPMQWPQHYGVFIEKI